MKRPIEIAIEIAVGLAVVAGAILSAEYLPDKDLPTKWFGLAASTVMLFGYPLYWARSIPKSARYWSYWSGFLILHLTILVPLLIAIGRWPLVWFVFTTMAEFLFIYPALTKTLATPLPMHTNGSKKP
jgi:hypothetical protein